MKKNRGVFYLVVLLTCFAVFLGCGVDPAAQENAIQFIMVLFSAERPMGDAPVPEDVTLIKNGQRRSLTESEVERLHSFLGKHLVSGGGGFAPCIPKMKSFGMIEFRFSGRRISLPVYELGGECSGVFRVEISAGSLQSVFYIRDESSRFGEFFPK